MHPKLIEIGGLFLPTYGVLLALAYLLALRVSVRLAEKEGINGQKVFDLGLWMLIASMVGAKLFSVFVDWEYYMEYPRELVGLLRLGGVYYGGFLCTTLVAVWYTHRHALPFWRIVDIFSVALPLGQAVGRVGCLAAGCCYGKPAEWGFSITFRDAFAHRYIGVPLDIPLHPTQIYLSVTGLLIFAVMWLLYRHRPPYAGWVFGWLLVVSSAFRFALEYLRGDPRGTFMNTALSTSQGVSLLLASLGVALLIYLRKTHRRASRKTQG
jgi:phosphatidylglycerol:prolipoprotein diacylglycerol transferase